MTDDLAVWRITPVAAPSDAAWQGRFIWKELRIIAASAGAALYEAGLHARQVRGVSDQQSQDHQQFRSGLADAKLYRVDRTSDEVTGPAGTVVFEELS